MPNDRFRRRLLISGIAGLAATLVLAAGLLTLVQSPLAIADAPRRIVENQRIALVETPLQELKRPVVNRKLPPRPAQPTGDLRLAPKMATTVQLPASPPLVITGPWGGDDSAHWQLPSPILAKLQLPPLTITPPSLSTNRELAPLVAVKPVYPAAAWIRGISGWVLLLYTVTKKGRVTDLKVVSSEPPSVFNGSALAAAKKWRYQPRVENGTAVDVKNVWSKVAFDAAGPPTRIIRPVVADSNQ